MAVEHALEKAMIEWLNKSGHYAVAVKSGMIEQLRYGYHSWVHLAPKGTPDIFACIKGKFVGIEVKKDEKEKKKWQGQVKRFEERKIVVKSSERAIAQSQAHKRIRSAGGLAFVCASIDELKEIVGAL